MSLSDFTNRFREETEKIDSRQQYLGVADRGLENERLEKSARRQFISDITTLGHEWSEEFTNVLTQAGLDRGADLRIPGAWVVLYLALCSEGVFEKLKVEAQEAEAEAERLAIKKPTIADQAPTAVRIEGNRTITTHRREGDEGIPAEDMEALRPENLDKKTLKDLKFKALQSRQEHMDPRAVQALNRGERTR